MQTNPKSPGGQLFVVATPIGNLEDISYRAVRVLREVDLIAAEDTRISRRLLAHYEISTPMLPCHEHNEAKITSVLIARLQVGQDIALITDAGTPLISDPGFRLLREARRHGIRVVPIPGPCSPIAALSASGLPADRFAFLGFLPRAGAERQRRLESIAAADSTQIFLESPRRLLATLKDLASHCGEERRVCVARELTKVHETFICGPLREVCARLQASDVRGEIVVLVAARESAPALDDQSILRELAREEREEMTASACARKVAKRLHVPRARVYALLLQMRGGGR